MKWAGHFRTFRYEIRRWLEGSIPDVHEAVASPVRLSEDLSTARRLLEVVPSLPRPLWGRDELHAGEMWNSNSIIAWVLSRSGVDMAHIHPPPGGRAPDGTQASSSPLVIMATREVASPHLLGNVLSVLALPMIQLKSVCRKLKSPQQLPPD